MFIMKRLTEFFIELFLMVYGDVVFKVNVPDFSETKKSLERAR